VLRAASDTNSARTIRRRTAAPVVGSNVVFALMADDGRVTSPLPTVDIVQALVEFTSDRTEPISPAAMPSCAGAVGVRALRRGEDLSAFPIRIETRVSPYPIARDRRAALPRKMSRFPQILSIVKTID